MDRDAGAMLLRLLLLGLGPPVVSSGAGWMALAF